MLDLAETYTELNKWDEAAELHTRVIEGRFNWARITRLLLMLCVGIETRRRGNRTRSTGSDQNERIAQEGICVKGQFRVLGLVQ
ncbi:hypothetical protein M378DRAFT_458074 [Amanita muscaria Koide BX008]|uniref:Uncharacterized protein n=1 Tax=Amanita muscaria (strain Koide BX008) TaxID=946122 RepID=A0A0C2WVB7_AMAMK|nr:hypothetical protein M378DRAFT_458074 [Amanita muscaria Koide BX008]